MPFWDESHNRSIVGLVDSQAQIRIIHSTLKVFCRVSQSLQPIHELSIFQILRSRISTAYLSLLTLQLGDLHICVEFKRGTLVQLWQLSVPQLCLLSQAYEYHIFIGPKFSKTPQPAPPSPSWCSLFCHQGFHHGAPSDQFQALWPVFLSTLESGSIKSSSNSLFKIPKFATSDHWQPASRY